MSPVLFKALADTEPGQWHILQFRSPRDGQCHGQEQSHVLNQESSMASQLRQPPPQNPTGRSLDQFVLFRPSSGAFPEDKGDAGSHAHGDPSRINDGKHQGNPSPWQGPG